MREEKHASVQGTGSESVIEAGSENGAEKGGIVKECVRGAGLEQTRSARDSICSHGLMLRHYKYLMRLSMLQKNPYIQFRMNLKYEH